MWKAFDEIERVGWLPARRRPMVSLQARDPRLDVNSLTACGRTAGCW
jgi:hypothetical protein